MTEHTEITAAEISKRMDRELKRRAIPTRAYREHAAPSEATIEAWEAEWERTHGGDN